MSLMVYRPLVSENTWSMSMSVTRWLAGLRKLPGIYSYELFIYYFFLQNSKLFMHWEKVNYVCKILLEIRVCVMAIHITSTTYRSSILNSKFRE